MLAPIAISSAVFDAFRHPGGPRALRPTNEFWIRVLAPRHTPRDGLLDVVVYDHRPLGCRVISKLTAASANRVKFHVVVARRGMAAAPTPPMIAAAREAFGLQSLPWPTTGSNAVDLHLTVIVGAGLGSNDNAGARGPGLR